MAAYPVEDAARWAGGAADRGMEFVSRQLYWRMPVLRRWYQGHAAAAQWAGREASVEALHSAGIRPGAVVLLHSGLSGVSLRQQGSEIANPLQVASAVLSDVLSLLGPSGTLAMPTHPRFAADPGFMHADQNRRTFDYDPAGTPSGAGLLSELFRRRRTVARSLHPLSSLCATGPHAEMILAGNLREGALPHGADSGYWRISRLGGLVVSIGRPLIQCMTMIHVAEELRDTDWPIADFFGWRQFRIRQGSIWTDCRIRERRPRYVRCLLLRQLRRDLLREGILHEGRVGNLRLDYAAAQATVEYMLTRNRNSTYPYLWPRTAHLF